MYGIGARGKIGADQQHGCGGSGPLLVASFRPPTMYMTYSEYTCDGPSRRRPLSKNRTPKNPHAYLLTGKWCVVNNAGNGRITMRGKIRKKKPRNFIGTDLVVKTRNCNECTVSRASSASMSVAVMTRTEQQTETKRLLTSNRIKRGSLPTTSHELKFSY